MCGSHHIRTNLTQFYAVRTKKPRIVRGLKVLSDVDLVVVADQHFCDLDRVSCCAFAYVICNNP